MIDELRESGMDVPISVSTPNPATTGWEESLIVRAALWLAVCGCAAFAILSLFGSPVGEFDDAIPLVGGMLVKQGLTPGPDFYSVYPPLGLYVNAFLFSLFGRTVVVTRLFDAALYIVLLFLATRLFRRRLPHAPPLIPAATLLFSAGIGGAVGIPWWPGFAIALAGFLIYLTPRNSEGNSLFAVAASGAVIGISLLYRANFGSYVAAAVIVDLLLRRAARGGRLRFEPDFKAMGAFVIPIVVCCLGFYLLVYGTRAPMVVTRLLASAGNAIAVRFLTLGFSWHLVFALMFPALWFCFRILKDGNVRPARALVAAALAIALPAITLAGSANTLIPYLLVAAEVVSIIFLHFFARRLDQFELAVLLFYACDLHYYLSRADSGHYAVIPIAMAMLLPFAGFTQAAAVIESPSRPAMAGFPPLVFLAMAFLVIVEMNTTPPEISRARIGIHILASAGRNAGKSDTDLVVDSTPAPEWAAVYSDEDELRAIRYLRALTGGADPIFVGAHDHSRVFLNDLRFYWLADRPIGVRTFELEIGHATEADVQREIILDLQRNHVKWLVIDVTQRYFGDPDFELLVYQGSELLDAYIRDNFQGVARFGRYGILFASK